MDTRVFGLSLDDVASMGKFVADQELNFPLLSDPDGSVARKYGVLPAGSQYAERVTFVLDPEGVVRHIERGVDVRNHGHDLLELLVDLQD